VAERIKKSVRPYDLVGRYGGEEFLLVLPDCDLAQAFEIAERLRETLSANPVRFGARAIKVTASIGIAAVTEGEIKEPDELIQLADDALYRAKRRGRNCSQIMSISSSTPSLNPQPLPICIV
jgi:two-component system chemotaxis response regulator CheY